MKALRVVRAWPGDARRRSGSPSTRLDGVSRRSAKFSNVADLGFRSAPFAMPKGFTPAGQCGQPDTLFPKNAILLILSVSVRIGHVRSSRTMTHRGTVGPVRLSSRGVPLTLSSSPPLRFRTAGFPSARLQWYPLGWCPPTKAGGFQLQEVGQ